MDINTIIDNLSSKLGVTAEYLLPIMTRAKFTDGLIGFIVGSFILIVLLYLVMTKVRKLTLEMLEDSDSAGGIIIGIIFGAVVFLLTIIFWSSCLQEMINPEYYAIKEILAVLSGKQ